MSYQWSLRQFQFGTESLIILHYATIIKFIKIAVSIIHLHIKFYLKLALIT